MPAKPSDARYKKSPKGKARNKRYRQSAKGKAALKRYQQSAKGKAAAARYRQSAKAERVTLDIAAPPRARRRRPMPRHATGQRCAPAGNWTGALRRKRA